MFGIVPMGVAMDMVETQSSRLFCQSATCVSALITDPLRRLRGVGWGLVEGKFGVTDFDHNCASLPMPAVLFRSEPTTEMSFVSRGPSRNQSCCRAAE